jgi:hypothetical protein
MAKEFLAAREADHDLTLTISGDAESLRPRLREALETLGYTVLGEQPLYAKRGPQGGACYDCSFEALDYPTRLNISLKQTNQFAVLATFHYEVKSHWGMTRGDRQTLWREAQAIAALASERLALTTCPACATTVTDDSHFCRRCGAPLVVDVPELEVLRLTRRSRTAYHNMFIGLLVFVVAGLLFLPVIWAEPKLAKALIVFGSMMSAFALMALFQGIWQLHFALNPKAVTPSVRAQSTAPSRQTTALPSSPSSLSVTEATTELLDTFAIQDRRTLEPLPRRHLETGELLDTSDNDDDRLM